MGATKRMFSDSSRNRSRTNLRPVLFVLAASVALFAAFPAAAQDGFGFDDESATAEAPDTGQGAGLLSGVSVGGKVVFDTTAFFAAGVSAAGDTAADTPLSGLPTGRLDFKAQGASVDAVLKLRINESILKDSPASMLDEASVRIYLGKVDLEGGLLKRSWGKADNEGPLDVLNPYDRTDLTLTEILDRKIAQPMLSATLALGPLSKVEAVFLPGFEGHRIADSGPWAPLALTSQKANVYNQFYYGANPSANGGMGNGLYASYYSAAWASVYSATFAQVAQNPSLSTTVVSASAAAQANATVSAQTSAIAAQAAEAANGKVVDLLDYPETDTLEYAQGGLRYTTSFGGADFGLQYFYGFLPTPVANADPLAFAANGYRVPISFNRYHQAGVDLATVLLGLNLRAELAANVTEDLEGDDPLVTNPAIAWALGFDVDLFAGISLNVQGSGSLRLLDDKVGTAAFDVEDGTDALKSRVLGTLMQKLFKETVEWKMTAVYDVQDGGLLLNPTLAFIVGDARLEAKAGWFTGGKDSELGQFADSSYGRVSLSYAF